MKQKRQRAAATLYLIFVLLLPAGCQSAAPSLRDGAPADGDFPKVLAVQSFVADMAQNVAGDRLQVQTLMPLGLDPHTYEPTPQDVARVAEADVLVVNGAGYEEWLNELLANAGGERLVIEASEGLTPRTAHADEEAAHDDEAHTDEEHHHAVDPHFWLDPTLAVHYVENLRDGLSSADPAGAESYAANAAAYIAELNELDGWIQAQIEQIPAERLLLVTNHENLGYYADRYGLQIVGAVIPSISTSASPSAQQLAGLVDLIRSSGAPAIFVEANAAAQLAQQLHDETGVTVVTNLHTESLTPVDGDASTYLDMMRYNTQAIVDALK